MLGDTYNVVDLALGRQTVKHEAWECFALAVNMAGRKTELGLLLAKKLQGKREQP